MLNRANSLEADPRFMFARNGAMSSAKAFSQLHGRSYGVIVKEDRSFLERFTKAGALIDIQNNPYSITTTFEPTAYGPVQPELAGYIQAPASIQNAVSVNIYLRSSSISVDYNAYARSVNAPVYVKYSNGVCTVYGASSSRGC